MGTIAEKLSYLNDTKELFKDRLNSLGAEITSSTTFRNYLNWLDTFYNEVSDKTDISANGVVGRTSQNTAILPNEYTQVDYIESHGAEYIDTGVNADTNLRVVLDMAFTRGGSANQNVGAINLPGGSNNARYHILTGGGTDEKIRIFINDNGLNLGLWDNDRHLFDINPLEGYASYDDAIRTIPTDIKDVGLNFWLFGRNAIGTALYYSYVKQWACQMYYENKLVRDFIPCYRNSDNEVGLYDIVNDVFYTNQGAGAFTYGSVVSIPNPDYPQPINNLSGNVSYKVSGKNLIGLGTQLNGYRDTSTSKFQTNTNAIGYYFKTSDLPDTITFTGTNSNRSNISYYNETPALNVSSLDYSNSNSTPRTINVDKTYQYIHIQFSYNQEVLDIQVEEGNSATEYEPYIEPQTFNIPLGNIELCKINTYEDKIYSSNGKFYLYKNIGKVVLNGSESWKQSSVRAEVHNILLDDMLPPTTSSTTYINGISNTFLNGASYNQLTATATYMNYYNRMSATNDKYMSFSYEFTTSINDWKTWLSTHNIIAYYVLLETTTTEITQENYPSLYTALKQIQDYLTAYKINKEFILGYSSPEIEY